MKKVSLKFQTKEEPKLEGQSKVIIQTEEPSLWSSASAVHMKYEKNECVAFIDSVIPGPALLLMDKLLRLHLNAKVDSQIEIYPLKPSDLNAAMKAVIFIHPNWLGTIGEKWVKESLLNKPVTINQQLRVYTLKGSEPVIISEITPSPFAIITDETKMDFRPLKDTEKKEVGVTYSDIGGLGSALAKIRELIELPLRLPDAMAYLGIEPPKGILLYGPPRTGKTLIAKALANEVGAQFFYIQGPEIISPYYGKSEEKLREIFKEAQDKAPSIILIDEIDSIAPKRDAVRGELEIRVVSTLLSLMDGLKETKGVIVVGTTNRPNAIDPAIRAPGRLEYEIYIGIPNAEGRKEILEIHTKRRGMPLAEDVDFKELAERTHGFVGGDIAFLCREAGYSAFRRYFNEEKNSNKETFDLSSIKVTMQDFKNALEIVRPSALRELLVLVPKDVTWGKIGGLREIKTVIEENIIQGIKNPLVFKEMGIRPARGILLYGPPGTGKTLIAKALANDCGANFISIKGPELRSKWFGESEEKIRFIFDTARKVAPCIIFFDELDALAPIRGTDASGLTESLVNQLLAEMDGIETTEGVFVVGATNRVELIDPALLRPGRFDYQIKVPLPDKEGRRAIFTIHLKKGIMEEDIDIEKITERTEGFSGAEIEEVCRLAALKALREVSFKRSNKVRMEHIISVIEEISQKRKEIYKEDEVKRYIS